MFFRLIFSLIDNRAAAIEDEWKRYVKLSVGIVHLGWIKEPLLGHSDYLHHPLVN